MATYLDKIVAHHRARAAADTRDLEELISATAVLPATRGFRARLESEGLDRLAVVAEIKRRSPSKGDLNPGLDPAVLARIYETCGATTMSVLTDSPHFGGSVADLQAARGACGLPVIRKDFTVDARDVCDTRLMGADCVLLIAAALSESEMSAFHSVATKVGLDVLVEIHDEAELEVAIAVGATLIGVNQRDLATFAVDHERALRMASKMPPGVVRVAESGVRDAGDARNLRDAGYHAVLVGESLVTSGDVCASLRALRVS
ncbi:MAG: indole-3-glycerol-phosphate synthase [Actinobacteria bacterium]|nr:indole-3-glycerol-phosphate synthase [Actinomycetota bacterium]